jgi:hypothetical protein
MTVISRAVNKAIKKLAIMPPVNVRGDVDWAAVRDYFWSVTKSDITKK